MVSEQETHWSLVHRAADGDDRARSSFGRAYLPLVRAFFVARWQRTALGSEIDDAVQEVFVDCFREGGALGRADSSRGEFRGYLFGMVRKVALRFEERARARPRSPGSSLPELGDLAGDEPAASVQFDRTWAQHLMRAAGDRMRALADSGDAAARLRVELLRLRFSEGLPTRDIAAQWGFDAEAVHRAYARARDEFKKCLRHVVAEQAVRTERDLDAECRRIFEMLG